jgi:hypothetical protein
MCVDNEKMRKYDNVIDMKRVELMKNTRRTAAKQFSSNLRLARRLWPNQINGAESKGLEALSKRYLLSVGAGEVLFLDGRWYVSHAGLLRVALRQRCRGIHSVLQERQSDPLACRWVFKATVFKASGSKGFVGYGDADPSNVSPLVRGAEMRVAETRAINRALRNAYGIGLCSVEELGSFSRSTPTSYPKQDVPRSGNGNGFDHRHPRLRDQLCLLIRQHNLDPALVKAYAADFCGTQTLKDAGRDLVESFISHVAKAAKEDRDALVCKLNSYAQLKEANS